MKNLFYIALLTLCTAAFADTGPRPPTPPNSNADRITISGPAATELGEALKGEYVVEYATRTSTLSVKIFYSKDGLAQIVCHKSTSSVINVDNETGKCTVEKSTNGSPLTRYFPRRRQG